MHRQRIPEQYKDKDGRQKQIIKEFLTYHVRLEGQDWLGNILRGTLEFEGRCLEPKKQVRVTTDEDGRQHAEFRMQGSTHKYYIAFTKKAVDDILEKTNTDKNAVKYYGKFGITPGSSAFRNGEYTYEQFVNTEWEDFEVLARKEG